MDFNPGRIKYITLFVPGTGYYKLYLYGNLNYKIIMIIKWSKGITI